MTAPAADWQAQVATELQIAVQTDRWVVKRGRAFVPGVGMDIFKML